MKIAIIGTGNVGGALGTSWAKSGHEIVFGSRHPDSEDVQELLKTIGSLASVASVAEAVAAGDVVVLTTPWDGTQATVEGAGDWNGKILIDVTNPVGSNPDALKAGLAVGHDTSGAELVESWAQGARVVKAFNTTGAPNMANPIYDGKPTVMFYCGDEEESKSVALELGNDLGFDMVDAGPLSSARLLEPFAMLWITLAFQGGLGVNFAYKIVKR